MIKYLFPLAILSLYCISVILKNEKELEIAKTKAFKTDSVCYHIEVEHLKKDTFKWYNNNKKMLPRGDRKTIYLEMSDYINLSNN
jgi:hypothetical protein